VDIQRGMDLYDQLDGWTTRHAMVGIRVAAYFPVPVRVKGTNKTVEQQVLYCGSVTKFGRALSEDDVSLYHVVFDDGDEQDFSEHELKMGIELFNLEGLGSKKDKEKNSAKEQEKEQESKKSSAAPTSAAKKVKSEKETRSLAALLDEHSGNAVAATSSRRNIHPDVAKSTFSKAAKEVKPTKAAVALFGAKSAKAHAASAAAAKRTTSAKSPKSASKKRNSSGGGGSIAATLDLLEEVGEEEGADDPVWTVQHASVLKRVAQHFEVPGGSKGKPKWEIYGGEGEIGFFFFLCVKYFTLALL